jgi:divalent metal cation (Fe/Co/Zn/Cd) transporter
VEGHSISEDIEEDLRKEFNITEVIIHVEPLV